MGTPGVAFEWTTEIEQTILNDIEAGNTLQEVANKHSISKALILKRVRLSEAFCHQYTRAMDVRTDSDFEGLADELASKPERTDKGIDPAWVNWKRLQIDTIKWALSKRNPKKYADRPPEINVAANLGIQLVHAIPRPSVRSTDPPAETIDAEVVPLLSDTTTADTE